MIGVKRLFGASSMLMIVVADATTEYYNFYMNKPSVTRWKFGYRKWNITQIESDYRMMIFQLSSKNSKQRNKEENASLKLVHYITGKTI